MIRRCGSSQPTPTPLPCEATNHQGNAKAENLKQRTEDAKKGIEHPGEWRNRQARELSLPQINEENGSREKGKRELCRKLETITKCESAGVGGGRVKNLASKTPRGRKNLPERATYETQLSRAEWTSCPTRGRRQNRADIYQENPPGKLSEKPRTKRNVLRRSNIQNRENRIKIPEGSGGLSIN